MSTHSAAILARGLGSRMRKPENGVVLDPRQTAQADVGVKGMIPIGRPFLDFVLSALADAGIAQVVLVLGPEHQAVREYFEVESPPARVRLRFAEQREPIGTANAVLAAASVIGNEPFLVLNADNYYPVEALRTLAQMDGAGVVAFDRDALVEDGNIDMERVRTFAILDISDEGLLIGIIEKPGDAFDPTAARAKWVSMNCWVVTPAIVDACRRVPRSARGEYELPEAVALAVREGVPVSVARMSAPVLDLSRRSDIATVAARLALVDARP